MINLSEQGILHSIEVVGDRVHSVETGEYGHVKHNCSKKGGPRSNYYSKWTPPTESTAVNSTLMVTGSIEGECMKILVGTGCTVTILREDTWKRARETRQLQLHLPVRSLVAANGEDLDLLDQSEVLGGSVEKHMILVANGLTQECLLYWVLIF